MVRLHAEPADRHPGNRRVETEEARGSPGGIAGSAEPVEKAGPEKNGCTSHNEWHGMIEKVRVPFEPQLVDTARTHVAAVQYWLPKAGRQLNTIRLSAFRF